MLRLNTDDLRIKTFQGHYLKHTEFQELLNIYLADFSYLLLYVYSKHIFSEHIYKFLF